MGVIADARRYAVDILLREAIGSDPWPSNGCVVLVDDPAGNRLALRYFVPPHQVYVLYSHRLEFRERDDGTVYVTPCPPRLRPPPMEPGVVYRVQTTHWALDWAIDGDPPPRPHRFKRH